MVRVRFERKQYDVMSKFEKMHHPDIWKFLLDKVGRVDNLSILDVSDEASIFSLNLAEQHPTNKLLCALPGEPPSFPLPKNVNCKKIDFFKNFVGLKALGTFDLIVCNEMTHEVEDFKAFFSTLREMLKPGAPIVVMARPKNPPIPVPDCCLPLWKKLNPTKEEVTDAAKAAGLNTMSFSAAVPVNIDRLEWEEILYSGCYPSVRNTARCNEQEIKNFINSKSGKVAFEEKLNIFLFRAA